MPIFALANAGVDLRGGMLGDALTSPVTWGVVAGLVLGKFGGIALGSWIAVQAGLGSLPQGVGMGSVSGGAALSGIGFTMSLLIISLALEGEVAGQAIVGVFIAMVLSWVIGWLTFTFARVKMNETSADLPTTLSRPVDPEHDHIVGDPDAQVTIVSTSTSSAVLCQRDRHVEGPS